MFLVLSIFIKMAASLFAFTYQVPCQNLLLSK
jgi:hypothetical protein